MKAMLLTVKLETMENSVIDNSFGIKDGRNFIHVQCFETQKDLIKNTNCIAGDSRHIGVDYMKEGQIMIINHPVSVYPNEGGGLTVNVQVVMTKQSFKRKFNTMCKRITEGQSIMF